MEGSEAGGPEAPPSPLSGAYLLIVLGEPHSSLHRQQILTKVQNGFLSWDKDSCHVDLEKELQTLASQSPDGEESKNGERLIQFASENLVTEVLIHPTLNTLTQCVRNLLSSFTRHRHIIHAGYTFTGNGSWIVQDGTFSLADLIDAFQEADVLRVLRAYENTVSVDVHCAPEGDWSTGRMRREPFSKLCCVRINPDYSHTPANNVDEFMAFVGKHLQEANLEQLLEPSDVVGNIRFSHPTLYVFPGGQGDAALFGINGFNLLVDGGCSRRACFWDFARHLDRLDAVLLTRLNNANASGLAALLRRKRQAHVYPQIGHFFCNLQERRQQQSPDTEKERDSLLVSLADIGHEMVVNLRQLQLKPHACHRDVNIEPINLYHKVGHGKLDMYVISPGKDSRDLKEFLAKWHANDQALFAGVTKKKGEFQFPLHNLVSICALLVWQPANPSETITRLLFPGSTPQHKIFEGLEKLKHLEYLKHPVCSAKSLSPSPSTLTMTVKTASAAKQKPVTAVIDKLLPGEGLNKPTSRTIPSVESVNKQNIVKSATIPVAAPILPESKPKATQKSTSTKSKSIDKVTIDRSKEKTELDDDKEIDKEKEKEKDKETDDKEKERIIETDAAKTATKASDKPSKPVIDAKSREPKSAATKPDVKNVKSKIDSRQSVERTTKPADRKPSKTPSVEKKADSVKSSPTTPKKTIESKSQKPSAARAASRARASPTKEATPAKSTKEENNRKVVESKKTTSAAPPRQTTPPKPPKKDVSKSEKRPPKKLLAASPSKTVTKTETSPKKSVSRVGRGKAKKEGVKKDKIESDRAIVTDSSTVSTPSTADVEIPALKANIEEKAGDKLEKDVKVDKKSDQGGDNVDDIEKLSDRLEDEGIEKDVESTDRGDISDDGDLKIVKDDYTAEKSLDGEETGDEKFIRETVGDVKEKICMRSVDKDESEREEEDEILVIEKVELEAYDNSTQEPESLESHGGEEVEDELQKHLRDETESEKKLKKDVGDAAEDQGKKIGVEEEEVVGDKIKDDEKEKESDGEEKKDGVEKKLPIPDSLKLRDHPLQSADVLSPEDKEKIVEEVQGIITSATEFVTKTKLDTKDVSDLSIEGKSSGEQKEPQDSIADKAIPKLDGKKEDSDEIKEKSKDQGDLKFGAAEESQPDERLSTTVESGATTAPTLPEDERIPLDEIKEIIEEKHVKEDTKEKEKVDVVQSKVEQPTSLPQIAVVGGRGFDAKSQIPRDIVKTPDEVADLPVHEEVDAELYVSEEFPGKDFHRSKDDLLGVGTTKKTAELKDEKEADLLEGNLAQESAPESEFKGCLLYDVCKDEAKEDLIKPSSKDLDLDDIKVVGEEKPTAHQPIHSTLKAPEVPEYVMLSPDSAPESPLPKDEAKVLLKDSKVYKESVCEEKEVDTVEKEAETVPFDSKLDTDVKEKKDDQGNLDLLPEDKKDGTVGIDSSTKASALQEDSTTEIQENLDLTAKALEKEIVGKLGISEIEEGVTDTKLVKDSLCLKEEDGGDKKTAGEKAEDIGSKSLSKELELDSMTGFLKDEEKQDSKDSVAKESKEVDLITAGDSSIEDKILAGEKSEEPLKDIGMKTSEKTTELKDGKGADLQKGDQTLKNEIEEQIKLNEIKEEDDKSNQKLNDSSIVTEKGELQEEFIVETSEKPASPTLLKGAMPIAPEPIDKDRKVLEKTESSTKTDMKTSKPASPEPRETTSQTLIEKSVSPVVSESKSKSASPEPTEIGDKKSSKSPSPTPSDAKLSKPASPEPKDKISDVVLEKAVSPVPSESKSKPGSPEPLEIVDKKSSKSSSPTPSDAKLSKPASPEPKGNISEALTGKSVSPAESKSKLYSPEPTEIALTEKSVSPAPTESISKSASPVPTEIEDKKSSKSPSPTPSDAKLSKPASPEPKDKISDVVLEKAVSSVQSESKSKPDSREPLEICGDKSSKSPSLTPLDAKLSKPASPEPKDKISEAQTEKSVSPAPTESKSKPDSSEPTEIGDKKSSKSPSPTPSDAKLSKPASPEPKDKISEALTEKSVSPAPTESKSKPDSPVPTEIEDKKSSKSPSPTPSDAKLSKPASPEPKDKISEALTEKSVSPAPTESKSKPDSPVPTEIEDKRSSKSPSPTPSDAKLSKPASPEPKDKISDVVLEKAVSPVPSESKSKPGSPEPLEIVDKKSSKSPSPTPSDTKLSKPASPEPKDKISEAQTEKSVSPAPTESIAKSASPVPTEIEDKKSSKSPSPTPSDAKLSKPASPEPKDKISDVLLEKAVSSVQSESKSKPDSPEPLEICGDKSSKSPSPTPSDAKLSKSASPEPKDKISEALTEKPGSPAPSESKSKPVSPEPSEISGSKSAKSLSPTPLDTEVSISAFPEVIEKGIIESSEKSVSPVPSETKSPKCISPDPTSKASKAPSEKPMSPTPSEIIESMPASPKPGTTVKDKDETNFKLSSPIPLGEVKESKPLSPEPDLLVKGRDGTLLKSSSLTLSEVEGPKPVSPEPEFISKEKDETSLKSTSPAPSEAKDLKSSISPEPSSKVEFETSKYNISSSPSGIETFKSATPEPGKKDIDSQLMQSISPEHQGKEASIESTCKSPTMKSSSPESQILEAAVVELSDKEKKFLPEKSLSPTPSEVKFSKPSSPEPTGKDSDVKSHSPVTLAEKSEQLTFLKQDEEKNVLESTDELLESLAPVQPKDLKSILAELDERLGEGEIVKPVDSKLSEEKLSSKQDSPEQTSKTSSVKSSSPTFPESKTSRPITPEITVKDSKVPSEKSLSPVPVETFKSKSPEPVETFKSKSPEPASFEGTSAEISKDLDGKPKTSSPELKHEEQSVKSTSPTPSESKASKSASPEPSDKVSSVSPAPLETKESKPTIPEPTKKDSEVLSQKSESPVPSEGKPSTKPASPEPIEKSSSAKSSSPAPSEPRTSKPVSPEPMEIGGSGTLSEKSLSPVPMDASSISVVSGLGLKSPSPTQTDIKSISPETSADKSETQSITSVSLMGDIVELSFSEKELKTVLPESEDLDKIASSSEQNVDDAVLETTSEDKITSSPPETSVSPLGSKLPTRPTSPKKETEKSLDVSLQKVTGGEELKSSTQEKIEKKSSLTDDKSALLDERFDASKISDINIDSTGTGKTVDSSTFKDVSPLKLESVSGDGEQTATLQKDLIDTAKMSSKSESIEKGIEGSSGLFSTIKSVISGIEEIADFKDDQTGLLSSGGKQSPTTSPVIGKFDETSKNLSETFPKDSKIDLSQSSDLSPKLKETISDEVSLKTDEKSVDSCQMQKMSSFTQQKEDESKKAPIEGLLKEQLTNEKDAKIEKTQPSTSPLEKIGSVSSIIEDGSSTSIEKKSSFELKSVGKVSDLPDEIAKDVSQIDTSTLTSSKLQTSTQDIKQSSISTDEILKDRSASPSSPASKESIEPIDSRMPLDRTVSPKSISPTPSDIEPRIGLGDDYNKIKPLSASTTDSPRSVSPIMMSHDIAGRSDMMISSVIGKDIFLKDTKIDDIRPLDKTDVEQTLEIGSVSGSTGNEISGICSRFDIDKSLSSIESSKIVGKIDMGVEDLSGRTITQEDSCKIDNFIPSSSKGDVSSFNEQEPIKSESPIPSSKDSIKKTEFGAESQFSSKSVSPVPSDIDSKLDFSKSPLLGRKDLDSKASSAFDSKTETPKSISPVPSEKSLDSKFISTPPSSPKVLESTFRDETKEEIVCKTSPPKSPSSSIRDTITSGIQSTIVGGRELSSTTLQEASDVGPSVKSSTTPVSPEKSLSSTSTEFKISGDNGNIKKLEGGIIDSATDTKLILNGKIETSSTEIGKTIPADSSSTSIPSTITNGSALPSTNESEITKVLTETTLISSIPSGESDLKTISDSCVPSDSKLEDITVKSIVEKSSNLSEVSHCPLPSKHQSEESELNGKFESCVSKTSSQNTFETFSQGKDTPRSGEVIEDSVKSESVSNVIKIADSVVLSKPDPVELKEIDAALTTKKSESAKEVVTKSVKSDDDAQEDSPKTVHRMVVTASSEDGGNETELCAGGSISFMVSKDSSEQVVSKDSTDKAATKDSVEQVVTDSIGKAPSSQESSVLKDSTETVISRDSYEKASSQDSSEKISAKDSCERSEVKDVSEKSSIKETSGKSPAKDLSEQGISIDAKCLKGFSDSMPSKADSNEQEKSSVTNGISSDTQIVKKTLGSQNGDVTTLTTVIKPATVEKEEVIEKSMTESPEKSSIKKSLVTDLSGKAIEFGCSQFDKTLPSDSRFPGGVITELRKGILFDTTRSGTPGSDTDFDGGRSSPRSDISSGQASRALTGSDEHLDDSRSSPESPGSPLCGSKLMSASFIGGFKPFPQQYGLEEDEDELAQYRISEIEESPPLFKPIPERIDEKIGKVEMVFKESDVAKHGATNGQGALTGNVNGTGKTGGTSASTSESSKLEQDKDKPGEAKSVAQSSSSSSAAADLASSVVVDPIKGWGKPLGLPPPPEEKNRWFPTWDPIEEWGKPLGLPTPAPPLVKKDSSEEIETSASNKTTPKKVAKRNAENNKSASNTNSGKEANPKSKQRPESPNKRGTSNRGELKKGGHIYVDLTYVPHNGNSHYSNVEFFRRVRARYYVFSGTEPSRDVFNALLEAKQTWDDKELEVTIIPTYDTDVLGYWVAENEEALSKNKIDLSPSASRCTINLQDHETSCSAYRLEF